MGVPATEVRAFTVHDSYVFAATLSGGVFRSSNRGRSWVQVNNGFLCWYMQALAAHESILYAGAGCLFDSGAGAYRSTDDGNSWTQINAGLTNIDIQDFAFRGTNVIAATAVGICRSTNNGSAWTEDAQIGYVRCLTARGTNAFAGRSLGGVVRSLNGGPWISNSTGLSNATVLALATNNAYVFAGTSDGVYRSSDGGSNWTLVNNGLTNSGVTSLAVFQSFLFAGTSRGVFRSSDNGESWTDVGEGILNRYTVSLAADDSMLYAGTFDGGAYRRPLVDLTVSVTGEGTGGPVEYYLYQNYPNPFNPVTRIEYQLPTTCHVSLKIFDLLGREVATLVNQSQQPGKHQLSWDANNNPSGVYLYRLSAGSYMTTRKMLLVR